MQYYINRNDKIRGPFSEERLRELYAEGKLRDTDFVSSDPNGSWQSTEQFFSRASRSRSGAARNKSSRARDNKPAQKGMKNAGNKWIYLLATVVAVIAMVALASLFNTTPDADDSALAQADQTTGVTAEAPAPAREPPQEKNESATTPVTSSVTQTMPQRAPQTPQPATINGTPDDSSVVNNTPSSDDAVGASNSTAGFATFESAMTAAVNSIRSLSAGKTKQFETFQERLKQSTSLTDVHRLQLEKWNHWIIDYRDELQIRFPETRSAHLSPGPNSPPGKKSARPFRGVEIKAVENPGIMNEASREVQQDIAATAAALEEEIKAYGIGVPEEKPYLAVVVGQVALSDHPENDNTFVQTHVHGQCEILPGGYFATAIGDTRKPLVFSAIGYSSVALSLGELTGNETRKYVQKIVLEKLPPEKTVKLRGQIVVEQSSPEILSSGKVVLNPPDRKNTPGNNLSTIFQRGWDYRNRHFSDQRQAGCDAYGFYEINGLTPDDYSITWTCDQHAGDGASEVDLWSQGSAPSAKWLKAVEAFNVIYVASWQRDRQETQNLGTNELWRFYDRPGDSRQGWGFQLNGARSGLIEISSTHAPWYIAMGMEDSIEALLTKVDQLQVRQVSGRVSVTEGNVLLAKNHNQKEWVLFKVQKGKISSPTIVVAPRKSSTSSSSPPTMPNEPLAVKSAPAKELSPTEIRETENWLREALKTQVPGKLDFPGRSVLKDVICHLEDAFSLHFGEWKGKFYRMRIVMDPVTLKRMKANGMEEILVDKKVVVQGKTLAQTLNIVLASVPGSALTYEIRDGQIVIITDTGSR